MKHRFFVILAAAAAALGWSLRAQASPDPYEIFSNARAYWMTQRYPQLLSYTVAVDIVEGGRERVERYTSEYDAANDMITVDPTSDYQREHPTYASGINIAILSWRVNKPVPPVDFLGVPHLAPTYSFGMAPFVPAPAPTPFNSMALVAEIRKEFHDPNPRVAPTPTPDAQDQLKQIAVVVARNRDYSITLLGTQTIDGHPCYHLGLTPLHDPGRYRIRQAWIDETTYEPWQLLDALNFQNGAGTDVAWMIHFGDIDGAHYIREEDAQAPMATGGEIYTKTAIRFENVQAEPVPTLRAQIIDNSGTPLMEPPWPGGKEQ